MQARKLQKTAPLIQISVLTASVTTCSGTARSTEDGNGYRQEAAMQARKLQKTAPLIQISVLTASVTTCRDSEREGDRENIPRRETED